MNFIKKNWHKLVLALFIFIIPVFSFAQVTGTPVVKIINPIEPINSIPNLVQTILEGVIKISIPLVALAIVYCGFLFVAARGNSEKITEAKKALMYTLIGAAILFGSWALAKLISATVTAL